MYPYTWGRRRIGFPLFPLVLLFFVLMVFSWRPVLFMVISLAIVAFAFFSARCIGWRGWRDWHEGWDGEEKPKAKRGATSGEVEQREVGPIHYL